MQMKPAPHGVIEFGISGTVARSCEQAIAAVSQAQWPAFPTAEGPAPTYL